MNSNQINHLLASLNPAQKEAVLNGDGPVLVLAGAGSGKTRVLTHRVAYLLAAKIASPDAIMAVTFTNKAANEMRERLERIANVALAGGWIGTFHSLGARILRRESVHLGMASNFNIYDADDQLSCIKLIMEEKNFSTEQLPPRAIAHAISNAKNAFVGPEAFAQMADSEFERCAADVFLRYTTMLRENNAVDFDDLLMLPVVLFQQKRNILDYYQSKFEYLLVDEYQDTNRAQYLLLKMLAKKHGNLFVVGDDDQSIYRWRGADLRNILEFPKDYTNCKIFRLEQNYRSTKNILEAAHSVVVKNRGRHEKKLWTDKEAGEKVTLLECGDERQEAEIIVDKIQEEFMRRKRNFRDFAILYRTNAQSRVLEDSLRRHAIAYVIVGGLRFYERKEIKDILAYLKVVANPADTVSLRRIINYPLRGIGEATLQKLQHYALDKGLTFFDALAHVNEIPTIGERTRLAVLNFHRFIRKYIDLRDKISLSELVNSLVAETGIMQKYKQEGTPDAMTRMENIRELMQAVVEFAQAESGASLDGFLEQVSLVADIDSWDDRENAVTLMTLHSAKGLEFPVIFLCGLEDGLCPLSRNMDSRDELEEERRLFYVGATRAKEKLYLSYAHFRHRFGERNFSEPSRFLKELDLAYVEKESMMHVRAEAWSRPQRQSRPRDEFAQAMPDYEDFTQEEASFSPGMRVRHAQFGVGKIIKVQGAGARIKITVNFDSRGPKTLMVQYANLEIL